MQGAVAVTPPTSPKGSLSPAVAVLPSREQFALRDQVKAFAEAEIKPISAERDLIVDPMEAFPREVWRHGSRLGFRTLALPAEFGGRGMDILTHCLLLEELAVADAGLSAAFHQTWKAQKLLTKTEYLRQEWLPKFQSDDDFLLCIASTELEAGTDSMLPYDGADGGAQTTAERQTDGDWVINGKKHFIVVAGVAKGIFALCRTDRTKGMQDGSTLFFVPADAPGCSYGLIHSKLGWRLTPNAEILFENVRLPDGCRIGEVDGGLGFIASFGKPHAPTTAMFGIGAARAAYELTLEWVRTRRQGGKPIVEHQAVALKLADMWAEIELARTMAFRAAWSAENDPDHDVKLGILSQLYSAEMTVRVCYAAMQLWGGRGFMKEYPIEKIMRDCFASYHLDGLNDINRLRIVRSIQGASGGYIG